MWIVSHILQCFKLANPNSYARNVPSHCKHKKAAVAARRNTMLVLYINFQKDFKKEKM